VVERNHGRNYYHLLLLLFLLPQWQPTSMLFIAERLTINIIRVTFAGHFAFFSFFSYYMCLLASAALRLPFCFPINNVYSFFLFMLALAENDGKHFNWAVFMF
jgi:hypothetical protein